MAKDIRKTHNRIRYSLFGLMFLFVMLGLTLHSYPLLIVLAVVGVILALFGDILENRATVPFKKYNQDHYARYEPHHHH